MALNLISYTEKSVRGFLKYQITAYPVTGLLLFVRVRSLSDYSQDQLHVDGRNFNDDLSLCRLLEEKCRGYRC